MSRIKILDCTLRDGGYVNDWNFGEESIGAITNNLLDTGIDFVECGFISSRKETSSSKSIFKSIDEANQRTGKLVSNNDRLLFMINFGEYDKNLIIPYNDESCVRGIRVAFHKHDMHDALELCRVIKNKGYLIFIQPMNTLSYSKVELNELLILSNEISPYAVYMVDSLGVMRGKDIIDLFDAYDKILDENIFIGFHSHNNLQLSFSNSQDFIKHSGDRNIIIDSTLIGIGRGAGNLCTELIAQHLNENNKGEYDLLPILTTIDEVMYPLQSKYQWGYTIPYYLAATCGCHPNYATFLSNKQTLKVKDISALLKLIPDESKSMYDQKLIESIYVDFQSNIMDDSDAIDTIRENIADREVVVVAPGKGYIEYINEIQKNSNKKDCYVVSVNFIDSALNADMAFFGNVKRYSEYMPDVNRFKGKVSITSNIKDRNGKELIVNYADYLNDDPNIIDNSGLMLINLLSEIGVKGIKLAGFDGFDTDRRMNYYDGMGNVAERGYLYAQNKSMSLKLKQLSAKTNISFITPSMYEIPGGDTD